MRAATAMSVGVALTAFLLAVASPWSLHWLTPGATVMALEALTMFGGAAQSGMIVGFASLVIELAPAGDRQAFMGLASTFVAPTMLLPALGGLLVDWTSAPVVFALAALGSWIGFRAAARLPGGPALGPGATSLTAGAAA
jgi:hypothetical protein